MEIFYSLVRWFIPVYQGEMTDFQFYLLNQLLFLIIAMSIAAIVVIYGYLIRGYAICLKKVFEVERIKEEKNERKEFYEQTESNA